MPKDLSLNSSMVSGDWRQVTRTTVFWLCTHTKLVIHTHTHTYDTYRWRLGELTGLYHLSFRSLNGTLGTALGYHGNTTHKHVF